MGKREEILKNLATSVDKGNKNLAVESAKQALDTGIPPLEAINEGLIKGMDEVTRKWINKIYYLPQVILAADAMYGGLDILTPHIKVEKASQIKNIVICTVEGDVHDIGKNIVKTMLTAAGFNTVDMGRDALVEDVVKKAREVDATMVALSTLMTPTMESMRRVVEGLKEEGIKDRVKVIIGGAPVSQAFANEIGADLYAPSAEEAVKVVKVSI
jgi:corrinoid protein of di/trimethylamine methyltransferase